LKYTDNHVVSLFVRIFDILIAEIVVTGAAVVVPFGGRYTSAADTSYLKVNYHGSNYHPVTAVWLAPDKALKVGRASD
jgi:hypothetical protein